jgi:hypothetical protein
MRAQRREDEQARVETTSARGGKRNVSPVALKAQRALQDSVEITAGRGPGLKEVVTTGPTAQWVAILEKAVVSSEPSRAGMGEWLVSYWR